MDDDEERDPVFPAPRCRAIELDRLARFWFNTYCDPDVSLETNMQQAEAAVRNGWQPIS